MVTRGTKRTQTETTTTVSRPKRQKTVSKTEAETETKRQKKEPTAKPKQPTAKPKKQPTRKPKKAPKKTTKEVTEKPKDQPKEEPKEEPKSEPKAKPKKEPKAKAKTQPAEQPEKETEAKKEKHDKNDEIYETEDSESVYWRGWKEIFLVGTEWQNYDEVFKVRWDFDHLHEKLNEPLAKKPSDIYLWGTTEPQMVKFKSGRETIVYIPVIIAIVTTFPPPATVGITSVMREEQFVPFRDYKLDWVPYSVSPVLPIQPSSVKKTERPSLYALQCGQRQKAVKSLSEIKSTNYSYVLPYIFFPEKPSDDIQTNVNVVTTMDGKGVTFEYDWEMDDFEEVLKEVKEEHSFDDNQMTQLRELLTEEVKKTKKRNKEKRDERKARVDAMSTQEKESLKTIQFIKFYPQNTDPEIAPFMNPFINRYYGKAHKVLPEPTSSV